MASTWDARGARFVGLLVSFLGLGFIGDGFTFAGICCIGAGIVLATRTRDTVGGVRGFTATALAITLVMIGVSFGGVA